MESDRKRRWGQALASSLAAALLASCGPVLPPTPSTRQELAAALGEDHRPAPGRLTGGFGYAPCRQVPSTDENLVPDLHCPSLEGDRQKDSRDLAHSRIHPPGSQAAVFRGPVLSSTAFRNPQDPLPVPEDLHTAGIVELATGLAQHLDRAVNLLSQAADLAPDDPEILTDLASAYLLRGQQQNNPQDLALALDATDRAIRLAPDLPEAVFNHALALESWFLNEFARDTWQRYLELDSDSEWADEARERVEALSGPTAAERWEVARGELLAAAERGDEEVVGRVVREFPRDSWLLARDEVIKAWTDGVLASEDDKAAIALRQLGSLAQAFEKETGDGFLSEFFRSATTSKVAALALAKSQRGFEAERNSKDLQTLEGLGDRLKAAGNPFHLWVRDLMGLRLYRLDEYKASGSEYRGLLADVGTTPLPFLRGRAHWMAGLNEVVLGRYSEALSHYLDSVKIYRALGDFKGIAAIERLLAELFFLLGDLPAGQQHHYQAVTALPGLTSRGLRLQILASLARSLLDEEATLALYLHNLMLLDSEAEKIPQGLVDGHTYRSLDLLHLGRLAEAKADLAKAHEHLEEVRDLGDRERQLADLLLVESQVLQEDPAEAVESTTEALAYYRRTNHHFYLLPAYLRRARAQLNLGRIEEAQADLEAALKEAQAQSASLQDSWLYSLFQEQVRAFHEEKLLLLGRQDVSLETTFEAAELARAQTLGMRLYSAEADTSNDSRSKDRGPRGTFIQILRQRIPAGTVVVEFWVGREEVSVWAVQAEGVSGGTLDLDSQGLRQAVNNYSRDLQLGAWEASADAGQGLSQLLFGPIEEALADAQQLLLVPDRFLAALPSAALPLPGGSEPMIQQLSIAQIPNARFLLSGPGAGAPWATKPPKSVAVFSSSQAVTFGSTQLATLSHTEREAQEIAQLYRPEVRVALFEGAESTSTAFLNALGSDEIVHFSGHSLYSPAQNREPLLFFAPEDSRSSSLAISPSTLSDHSGRGTKLVILASCQSMAGPSTASEGPFSLAHAFLSTGVDSVLGTLWPVEDEEGADFFPDFHRGLVQGLSPADALRSAQIKAYRAGKPPRFWAAAVVFERGDSVQTGE